MGAATGTAHQVSTCRPVFVENRGQFQEGVRFRTALPWPAATVTEEGLVLTLLGREGSEPDGALVGHNVRLRFVGASSAVSKPAEGAEPAVTRCSYFLGSEASRWVTDVPCWSVVRIEEVAPGVSVDIHGRHGLPEYDLLIAPGRDAASVDIVVEGADDLTALADGSLELRTPLGVVRQLPPRAWEVAADGSERPLTAQIERLSADRFRFHVAGRDVMRQLVIDPGLAYGTFVEGSGTEEGEAIVVDDTGSAYVTGTASSNDFPVTPGAFQLQKAQPGTTWQDVFVARLNPAGSDLLFATYLGGTGVEWVSTVVLGEGGSVLVAGTTNAPDFPTTRGAYATAKGGSADAFLTKLDASGSALVFSTYFPGSGSGANSFSDLALDALGRIVLGGGTELAELPITPHAPQATLPKQTSGFIARMSADGSSVDFCTYVGCTSLASVAVDPTMAIYATGYGDDSIQGLPLTAGAFQPAYMGSNDAFAMKLSPTGFLQWCTILGGSKADRGVAIEVDSENRSIVAGWTYSTNFPSTPGAFDPLWNGDRDCFIVKFAPDGTELVWGTRLGGSESDELKDMAVDPAGNWCIQAGTGSSGMPVTPNAYASTMVNGAAYVAKLSADGASLLYGTYLDSSTGASISRGVATDALGNIYATGYTLGADFPTTPGAFDTVLSGSNGAYVLKIDLSTWTDVGQGLPTWAGIEPRLMASGSLQPGSDGSLHVDRAQGSSLCTIILGMEQIALPFKGGTMVPQPSWLFPFITNPQGKLDLFWPTWPALPPGLSLWFQAWINDVHSTAGYTASNGLTATVP